MNLDLYLVGVGGQGVLTIGDILAEAASRKGIPVNVYPTEGMAQRGGFVRSQVRFGREVVGPQIRVNSADLVIAMELSESLKAVRYMKPGGEFVLYGHIWPPTEVMLGKAHYPSLDQVREQIEGTGARLLYLDPHARPIHDNAPVPANIYVLGAAIGGSRLGSMLDAATVLDVLVHGWKADGQRNAEAFQAGLRIPTRA
jgi:indolepyruvate ferredoxin oxidoreductase beta subunit